MGSFRELEVWQLARVLVKDVYQLSAELPESERYGLRSQIQRAAVSIAANIAEGSGRKSDGSFVQFLKIALGSVAELETLMVLCSDLEFISPSEFSEAESKLRRIGIKLQNLILSLGGSYVREEGAHYFVDPILIPPDDHSTTT